MSARSTYLLCAALAVLTVGVSTLGQPSLTAENGLGWDGGQYAQMTSQCWTERISALEPFVYRIGAPCLAALVPATPKNALFIVNLASSVGLLFLLAAWLRQVVPAHIVPWLLVGFAFHWLAPLRYTFWYPTYIDPPALCVIVGALLIRHRPIGLIAVCAFGALIRETVAIVPIALAVGRAIAVTHWGSQLEFDHIVRDREWRYAMVAAAAAAGTTVFTHAVVTPASDYWMADAAYYWAFTKPVLTYALAWFVAYGPMLALPVVYWRPVRRFLTEWPEYLVMMIAVAVLAWVGGSDTERFLLWGVPIVLAMVGIAAGEIDWRRSLGPLLILGVGQILNGRWFLVTPFVTESAPRAWPLLTVLDAHRFEDLVSLTPDRVVAAVAFAQYLVLVSVLAFWFRRRRA